MAQTIGQLLQKEREQRGFTIADVAHDTRIHADTIRGLEADDYSVFSSTTYARSFLQLYSRHLDVDANEALHDFDSVTENLSSGNFSYLESVTSAIEPGEIILQHEDSNHSIPFGDERRQPFPLFLGIVVFLLLLVIPIFYFIGIKADSLEEAGTIFKEAISSKKILQSADPKDLETKDYQTPAEPLAVDESNPATQSGLPNHSAKKPRKNRFPAPLADSNLKPTTADSGTPLKAIPVIPKSPPSQNKTDTAQNP